MEKTQKKYPNSAKELRGLYNVSRVTWIKWLEPIQEKIRKHAKIYTPHELNTIIEHLDAPN